MIHYYKSGNILECAEDIIVQSVNHKGVMGSGLAKQIKGKWSNIDHETESYKIICRNFSFDYIRKTGLVSWYFADDKIVANIFGQESYGRENKRYTDYTSLINGLSSVFSKAKLENLSIAIPYGIGCGLGGGDWDVVLCFISELHEKFNSPEVVIYKY